MRLHGREVSGAEWAQHVKDQNAGLNVADYPRLLYRPGSIEETHVHADEPLKIQGKFECDTLTVENESEHLAALEAGWSDTPSTDAPAPKRAKESANG